jgi:hypothetical protein
MAGRYGYSVFPLNPFLSDHPVNPVNPVQSSCFDHGEDINRINRINGMME